MTDFERDELVKDIFKNIDVMKKSLQEIKEQYGIDLKTGPTLRVVKGGKD